MTENSPTQSKGATGQGRSSRQRLPWLRIGVEALAVVTSILLAFAIDAWWASRARDAEVVKTMVSLDADFHIYQEMLASREYSIRTTPPPFSTRHDDTQPAPFLPTSATSLTPSEMGR